MLAPAPRFRLAALPLAVVAVLALTGGCGSDDDDTDPTTTTTETTVASDDADAPTGDDPAEGVDPAGSSPALGEPASVPALDDPDQAALAEACHAGDLASCDELYFDNQGVEAAKDYGATCGGRLEEGIFGQCAIDYGGNASS